MGHESKEQKKRKAYQKSHPVFCGLGHASHPQAYNKGKTHVKKKRRIVLFQLALLTAATPPALGEEIAADLYYVPAFRSGHNLSLFASEGYNTWYVSQKGNNLSPENQIPSVSTKAFVHGLTVRYAYHINLVGSYGFFVGSSAGFRLSEGPYGEGDFFFPGYSIFFPTALGGLVWNLQNPQIRFLIGGEYGAALFPQMSVTTKEGERHKLSPVPNVVSVWGGFDKFWDEHHALSIQAGYRHTFLPCLDDCSNTSIYLNNIKIQGDEAILNVGVTWLLDGLF